MSLRSMFFSLPFLALAATLVKSEPLELYVDADYSISRAAAQSIQLGVETALNEVGNQLGGYDVRVVAMDHRGNVKRSYKTMRNYLSNDRALAMFGGLHSPPYLTHKDYINENRILTLLPWSAAGPITRANAGTDNWIFRLSVDDFQSGEFLIAEAADKNHCKRVALVLVETGWGRANLITLTKALETRGLAPASVEFFPTAIGASSARGMADRIESAGADCAILLANWNNGATIVNALYEGAPNLDVFSHWGITGGQFTENVSHDVRSALNLTVLQTCGLRREKEGSDILKSALASAMPGKVSLAEMSAPTGFLHGYDLTRILITAAEQAARNPGWKNSGIIAKRSMLRDALINLESQVAGILNTYNPPFSPFGPETLDAHEALGMNDLCMARFREDGLLEDAG